MIRNRRNHDNIDLRKTQLRRAGNMASDKPDDLDMMHEGQRSPGQGCVIVVGARCVHISASLSIAVNFKV